MELQQYSGDTDDLLLAAQLLDGGAGTTPHGGVAPPPVFHYGGPQPPTSYLLAAGGGPSPHMGAPSFGGPWIGQPPPPGFGAGSADLMPPHHQLPPQPHHQPWLGPPPHQMQPPPPHHMQPPPPHYMQQPPPPPAVVHPSWANVMRQRQQQEEQHRQQQQPPPPAMYRQPSLLIEERVFQHGGLVLSYPRHRAGGLAAADGAGNGHELDSGQWPALAPIRTKPAAAAGLNPAALPYVPLQQQRQHQQQQEEQQQRRQLQQRQQQEQQQRQLQRQQQEQQQRQLQRQQQEQQLRQHHHKQPKQKQKQQQQQQARPFVVKRDVAAPRLSPQAWFERHCSLVNPFWVSAVASPPDGALAVAHLPPLSQQAVAADSVALVASCALSLELPASHLRLLQGASARLQLLCLLVDDAVPRRGHWPPNTTLKVNGTRIRPYTAKRASDDVLLKPKQIDLPLDITPHVLAAADSASSVEVQLHGASSGRGFVLGCMLVQDVGIKGIKGRMAPAVSLREAVARVQQQLSGGGGGDEDDGDVVMAATVLSLRCPLSGVRLTTPAHFGRSGLACFDLDAFLEMTRRSGKWQCPLSMALAPLEQLQEEPFHAAVLGALSAAGLDDSVDEVEVGPDARWRPKGVSGCWFDVMQPCSGRELRAALQGSGSKQPPRGVGSKRGRGRSDDGTDPSSSGGEQQQPQAKRRRAEAVDLTLGSSSSSSDDDEEADEEEQEPLAQRAVRVAEARENEPLAQRAARVAAARRSGGAAGAPALALAPAPAAAAARVASPPGADGGGLRLRIHLPAHAARPAVQLQPAGAGQPAQLHAALHLAAGVMRARPLPAAGGGGFMARREDLELHARQFVLLHQARRLPLQQPPAAVAPPAAAEVIELLDSDSE